MHLLRRRGRLEAEFSYAGRSGTPRPEAPARAADPGQEGTPAVSKAQAAHLQDCASRRPSGQGLRPFHQLQQNPENARPAPLPPRCSGGQEPIEGSADGGWASTRAGAELRAAWGRTLRRSEEAGLALDRVKGRQAGGAAGAPREAAGGRSETERARRAGTCGVSQGGWAGCWPSAASGLHSSGKSEAAGDRGL